jgi:hypothetical protein
MSEIAKLSFINKYGAARHKTAVGPRIEKVLDSGNTNDISDLAYEGLVTKPEHVTRIIDHKPTDGRHPGNSPIHQLIKYKTGAKHMTDDHWHRLALHPEVGLTTNALAHMPLKHVKTTAQHHPDDFTRQLATNHYVRQKQLGAKE